MNIVTETYQALIVHILFLSSSLIFLKFCAYEVSCLALYTFSNLGFHKSRHCRCTYKTDGIASLKKPTENNKPMKVMCVYLLLILNLH